MGVRRFDTMPTEFAGRVESFFAVGNMPHVLNAVLAPRQQL
jgi:hypothetical protein